MVRLPTNLTPTTQFFYNLLNELKKSDEEEEVDKSSPFHFNITSHGGQLDVNRCFEGDVIIEFPLRQEQREYIKKTCESLEKFAKEKIDTQKAPDRRYNQYSELWATALDNSSYDECGLTDFQKEQIKINTSVACSQFYPETRYGITGDVFTAITHNQYKATLGLLNRSSNSHHSMRELMAYDRNGPLFSLFRKCLKEVIDNKFRGKALYSSRNYPAVRSVNLTRYNNKDELEVLQILLDNSHQILTTWYIYGNNEFIERAYQFTNEKDALLRFEEIYKENTNKDYKENDIFSPIDGHYGHLEAPFTRKYQIPPLKKLCFSVLSELFLIDKNEFIGKIEQLTQDTFREFLIYCSENNKPVGGEIIEFLLNKHLKESNNNNESVDELFSFNILIPSIINRQQWICKSIMNEVAQSITRPSYNLNAKINVYENRHLFYSKNLPEENTLIRQKLYQEPVQLQDYSTFIKNINMNSGFTEKMTEDLWKNTVIIGGIMTSSLTGETKGFESSDIDVLFYGLSSEDMILKIKAIYEILNDGTHQFSFAMTDYECTIARHYPHRHVQISVVGFKSIEDILTTVDIDSSGFAFDGKNVWTTMRGIQSFNYRTNFATPLGHSIRGELLYQRRLLKYLDRGFSIAYLPNKLISAGLEKIDNDDTRSNGIEVLFKARNNPEYMNKLLKSNKVSTLPYGKGIDKEKFEEKVTNNFEDNYDGYNSSVWPDILESLDNFEDHYMDVTIDAINTEINHPFYHFANLNDYVKDLQYENEYGGSLDEDDLDVLDEMVVDAVDDDDDQDNDPIEE